MGQEIHMYIANVIVDTLLNIFTCRNRSSDRLPDIIWCREPFFEVMNEIEDMN